MNALDCTDIKALLSALIDDRLDERTRHEVERHLAQCDGCRQVLSEAERVDALIAMSAELGLHESPHLPRGFEDAVLAETVRPDDRAVVGWVGGVAMWTGWIAAAASIALAGAIWFADRPPRPSVQVAHGQPEQPRETSAIAAARPEAAVETQPAEVAVVEAPAAATTAQPSPEPTTPDGGFASAEQLRASAQAASRADGYSPILGRPRYMPLTLSTNPFTVANASHTAAELESQPRSRLAARDVPDISQFEADAIYNVSLLLHILADADLGSFADVERIRRVVEADDLLDLLAEVRERVDPADRPALLAAEAVLVRLVQGPLDREDVRMLRETVARLDLFEEVGSITQRWDAAYSL